MLVAIIPLEEIEDTEYLSLLSFQQIKIDVSHSFAETFGIVDGVTLSLSWYYSRARTIGQCRIQLASSTFSKRCNSIQSKLQAIINVDEENEHNADFKGSNLCKDLNPSSCIRCLLKHTSRNVLGVVGVSRYLYNEYKNPLGVPDDQEHWEWGYLEYRFSCLPVADHVKLRLVHVNSKDPSNVLTHNTESTLQHNLKKRKDLWEAFDTFSTPIMTMLVKSQLTGMCLLQDQPLSFRHSKFTSRFRIESVLLRATVQHTEEMCTRCGSRFFLPFRIMPQTEITIGCPRHTSPKTDRLIQLSKKEVGISRVGGCSHLIKELYDILVIPLLCPNLFCSLGIQPPKGILLYGPPGTGKTHLARAFIEEMESRWEELKHQFQFLQPSAESPPILEIFTPGDFHEGMEHAVTGLFQRIHARSSTSGIQRTTLLFIDEIDTLCPSREDAGNNERRVIATFLTELDGLQSYHNIILLAATNRPNSIDSAFRRAGRIDRELEVDVPSAEDRVEILSVILRQQMKTQIDLTHDNIRSIALDCHAFVAADIKALCTMAGVEAIREAVQEKKFPQLRLNHFQQALKYVKPSAMKEVAVEVPHVVWEDIGGYDSVKSLLQECVEWPIKHRSIFSSLRITPPRGLLLYGPPGCSKTLLAKAVATESRMNFISVKGPELFSKWVGESEKAVRDIFRKARQNAPCIIFFDEIDAIGGDRHAAGGGSGVEARVLSQMLNEMDGIQPVRQVLVIGATNRPDLLDAALLRPGRLDRLVYVPLPDEKSRKAICRVHLSQASPEKEIWSDRLASATEGYSGAEIAMVCREACMSALREYLEGYNEQHQNSPKEVDVKQTINVTWNHIEKALQIVRPRISNELVQFFESYTATLYEYNS